MGKLRSIRVGSVVVMLAMAAWLLPACGDDDEPAGSADTAGADTSDAGGDGVVDDTGGVDTADEEVVAGPVTYQIVYHEVGEEGEDYGDPIEGMHVAIDRASGREELVSDAEGMIELTLGPDEVVTLTEALEGYQVNTFFDITQAVFEENLALQGEEVVRAVVPRLEAQTPETVELTASQEGIPDNGWWCYSPAEFTLWCIQSGADLRLDVPTSSDPVRVTAMAFNADDSLADFTELELPSLTEDTEITITFDVDSAETVTTITDVEIRMPDDPESPLRTEGPIVETTWPVFVWEPGTYRARGATVRTVTAGDNSWVLADVAYVPLEDDEPIFWIQGGPRDSSPYRSVRFFRDPLEEGASYDLLDVPRAEADGDDLGATVRWQAITDAVLYRSEFYSVDPFVARWVVTSRTTTEFSLPPLPSAYDASVDWDLDSPAGFFRVYAFRQRRADPAPDDPQRIDWQYSAAFNQPIDLTLPE